MGASVQAGSMEGAVCMAKAAGIQLKEELMAEVSNLHKMLLLQNTVS